MGSNKVIHYDVLSESVPKLDLDIFNGINLEVRNCFGHLVDGGLGVPAGWCIFGRYGNDKRPKLARPRACAALLWRRSGFQDWRRRVLMA